MSDFLTGLPSLDLGFCENSLQRLNGGAGSVVATIIPDDMLKLGSAYKASMIMRRE